MARKALTGVSAVVLALVLALVVPGFSQPFADVPTNHWAYDAIAELAAKGLIEGYPDGTFKGGQPLTRYEMAMVVARLVARIEAIPTPPPPEVRRADLDAVRRDIEALRRDITTIQRLVNEFRAELQALGVRVTALEEELSALRARLDNTRVTGDFITWVTNFSNRPERPLEDTLTRIRLTYTGRIADNVSATLRARYFTFSGLGTRECRGATGTTAPCPDERTFAGRLDFDRLYLDWSNAFDISGLRFRFGRDVVTLGPVGLLLDETYWNQNRNGARLDWAIGPVNVLGFVQWPNAFQNNTRFIVGGRLSFDPIPGWTLGLNVRGDVAQVAADGGVCPGSDCRTGFGVSGDLKATLIPGLTATVEFASYTPTNDSARSFLYAEGVLDLGTLAGLEMLAPKLTVWYKSLDRVTGSALGDLMQAGAVFSGPDTYDLFTPPAYSDLTAVGGRLDLKLLENFSVYGLYETATFNAGGNLNTLEVGATWTLAPRTDLNLFFANYDNRGTVTQLVGAYLTSSW